MAKLTETQPTSTETVLVFGPPKSGKTELTGRLSERYNLKWFDLERGVGTLRKLPIDWQERIDVVQLPDTRAYPIAIETCLKIIKGGPVDVCVEHGKVSCALCKKDNKPSDHIHLAALNPKQDIVVFDSLTQLTNSAIAHITKGQPDDYKMNYDDWAALGKLMDTFLSHIQNAPYNVVCISHEMEVEMQDGKQKLVATAGTRNFSRNTAKYFGHVVYAEIKNKKHVFGSSTTYANNILTGSRSDVSLESAGDGASLIQIFSGEKTPVVAVAGKRLDNTQGMSALERLKASQAAKTN